jgi:hypothetical protein
MGLETENPREKGNQIEDAGGKKISTHLPI